MSRIKGTFKGKSIGHKNAVFINLLISLSLLVIIYCDFNTGNPPLAILLHRDYSVKTVIKKNCNVCLNCICPYQNSSKNLPIIFCSCSSSNSLVIRQEAEANRKNKRIFPFILVINYHCCIFSGMAVLMNTKKA